MKNLHKIIKKLVGRYIYAKIYIATGGFFQGERKHNKIKLFKYDDVYLVKWGNEKIFIYNLHRITRYVRNEGFYYIKQKMFNKYCKDKVSVEIDDIVIDVGANIGEFTRSIVDKAGLILAIEPDPIAFKCLKLNLEDFSNTRYENCLLSNSNREVDFYISSDTADSSMIEPEKYDKVVKVSAVRLDYLINKYNLEKIDFLKIEAEGAEPEVLTGAINTLKITRKVSVDCSKERMGNDTIDEVRQLLKENGFETYVNDFIVSGLKI